MQHEDGTRPIRCHQSQTVWQCSLQDFKVSFEKSLLYRYLLNINYMLFFSAICSRFPKTAVTRSPSPARSKEPHLKPLKTYKWREKPGAKPAERPAKRIANAVTSPSTKCLTNAPLRKQHYSSRLSLRQNRSAVTSRSAASTRRKNSPPKSLPLLNILLHLTSMHIFFILQLFKH